MWGVMVDVSRCGGDVESIAEDTVSPRDLRV